jgi:DNA-binding CsgD family transcriptional regulator
MQEYYQFNHGVFLFAIVLSSIKVAQHRVQPTWGTRRDLGAFSWLLVFPTSQAESHPTHPSLTPAVGWHLAQRSKKEKNAMAQFPRLSNREWEVINLLLQSKSNKMIASSLGVSKRTVEFHLKNIYAKFQVNSRIELILKLVNATGMIEVDKLRCSTVVGAGENAENRDKLNSRMKWATYFRDAVSIFGQEFEMKNLLKSVHVFVGIVAALLTGFLWIAILQKSVGLSVEDFTIFTIPFVIVLAMIGLIVGVVGKRRGDTFLKVLFSVLFGTGLSPITVIPLMMFVVIPIGRVVANLGIFDPSTIPGETASNMAMSIMLMIWLVVSITLGIVLLMLSIKIKPTGNYSPIEEHV